jgi:hypothetical protein
MALTHRGRKNSFDRMNPMEPMEPPDPDYLEAEFHAEPADPPADLSPRVQEWWRTVTSKHRLESHHFLLLEAAARAEIGREGLTYLNREGEPRPRPECAVLRDSRAAFAKIVRALGLDPTAERSRRVGGHGYLVRD